MELLRQVSMASMPAHTPRVFLKVGMDVRYSYRTWQAERWSKGRANFRSMRQQGVGTLWALLHCSE